MARGKSAIYPVLNITEEVSNSVTHGLGALAAIAGLILGLAGIFAPVHYKVSFILYGSSLILLMTVSALYHAF